MIKKNVMKNLTMLAICIFAMVFSVKGQDNDLATQAKHLRDQADSYFIRGDYENAYTFYNRYQDTGNGDVSALIAKSKECRDAKSKADSYFNSGDCENAAPLYYRILQLNSYDSYAESQYKYCIDHRSGRSVSFGITTGIVMANFNTQSSGNLGSAIYYGYASEGPSYTSKTGFSGGIILDIRLNKNLYLQTGLNYVNVKVKNSFENSYNFQAYNSKGTFGVDPSTTTTYVKGDGNDKFIEQYELNYFELPLLLSYRIRLFKKSYFQINVGPYIGYGLSGTCRITGTTDWPSLIEYNKNTNVATGESYHMSCIYDGVLDLFNNKKYTDESGNECVGKSSITYTTGERPYYEYYFLSNNSPFQRLNAGFSLGSAFEFSGFFVGFSYDLGMINIANDGYWNTDRMNITLYDATRMDNYQHKLNKLQVKVGYIFRW